jgi:hypothetical protein
VLKTNVISVPGKGSGDHELVGQLRERSSQLGCRLELRHWVELFECAAKRVRETPHLPGRKFRVLRLEIQPVYFGEQSSRGFELAVNERRVEDQLRRLVGDLRFPPQFPLALQRLEVPLNSVHANRERINEIEALGVLGKHGREHA